MQALGSARFRRRLHMWLMIVAAGAVIGYFYVELVYRPTVNNLGSNWQGARGGFFVAGTTAAFEIFVIAGNIGAGLRRLPFLALLAVRALAHAVLITLLLKLNIWIGLKLGENWATDIGVRGGFLTDIAFSFVAMSIVLFMFQVRNLIGGRTLRNFILGRYHRPTSETRVFLLVDLVGSTPIAERLGNLRFHEFLSRFFFDIDAPIVENAGEVHSYVGDAVIASWPLGDASNRAKSLSAVQEILATLATRAPEYRKRFGVAPQARLALHVGEVVTGECGDSRRQITYLGDTLNTVARLETLAKALDAPAIASLAVVRDCAVPKGLIIENLGPRVLTGIAQPLELVTLRA